MAAQKQSKDYRHSDEKALLRPEAGAQDVFPDKKRKPAQKYRYDSSLAPELQWDEAQTRAEAEQHINAVLNADSLETARAAAEKLRALNSHFLNWSGKAEFGEFEVPSLPLFVHERLSTAAVRETLERHKRNRNYTLDLYGEGPKSISEGRLGAYEHLNGWQNRLILGDSLQVMNSLLTYEYIGNKVQMVYIDPPYGIKFGSNFMPFVRKRNVKDGDDGDLTREPEMVQAYRDTWRLGIHSWLTYMRDRLLLARELLADSGSVFVQIGDENVHLVRNVMDEVFGSENFVNQIGFRTAMTKPTDLLNNVFDYCIWYAKEKKQLKFRELFVPRTFTDGDEIVGTQQIEASAEQTKYSFQYEGKTYNPAKGWRVSENGLKNLAKSGRLHASGSLRFIRYAKDFPYVQHDNIWNEQLSEQNKIYVVQTNEKVIQRCMLMTTDPGDLVFDPTCGSGTTAIAAERWGRRWITCDVSRVPLALTRQRLLTATYDYYKLQNEQIGPAGGFVYERKQNAKGEEIGGIVPHITLSSIANAEPPAEEVLVDKPEKDNKFVRITGPFCVEAVIPPSDSDDGGGEHVADQDHAERMRAALDLTGKLQLPGNRTLELADVRAPARSMHLDAEGRVNSAPGAFLFGAPDAAVSELAVIEAAKEARHKGFEWLVVVGFAIAPEARAAIENSEDSMGVRAVYAQASGDLALGDLLKNARSNQLFAVCGLPEVAVRRAAETGADNEPLYEAELLGLDVFDPDADQVESRAGADVPCWMLDPDYDGQCFRAGQVFFPRTRAWDKIKRAVKADFDESVWDRLAGATSAPFPAGEYNQIAVKVIDDRGNELLVVKSLSDVE